MSSTWELGTAGKAGSALKALEVAGQIGSLATAGKRQEETVGAYKDLANLTGESVQVDDAAKNAAILGAKDDSEDRASTLATLLEQGIDPAAAAKIIEGQKKADVTQLISALDSYGRQKGAADERAKQRRTQFDAIATQAGLPIDYWAKAGGIAGDAGEVALGYEALSNPVPTARSGRILQYMDGGGLQTTQGASDHSENPMMITNKDGSPAVDGNGNQIEVTGKETIIPDWLMDQLIEAANKSPKELSKVFKDEILDEERFQA